MSEQVSSTCSIATDKSPLRPSTMRRAAVAVSYDMLVIPKPKAGRTHHKAHEIEEHRTSAVCVAKIADGKLAQEDLVIDTQPFKGLGRDDYDHAQPEIACIVM